MKCPKCKENIKKDSVFCEHCGIKIIDDSNFSKENIMANPFGILSLLVFLITIIIFVIFLPWLFNILNISTKVISIIAICGYGLTIALGILSYIFHRKSIHKHNTELSCKTGITVLLFSIFFMIMQITL